MLQIFTKETTNNYTNHIICINVWNVSECIIAHDNWCKIKTIICIRHVLRETVLKVPTFQIFNINTFFLLSLNKLAVQRYSTAYVTIEKHNMCGNKKTILKFMCYTDGIHMLCRWNSSNYLNFMLAIHKILNIYPM